MMTSPGVLVNRQPCRATARTMRLLLTNGAVVQALVARQKLAIERLAGQADAGLDSLEMQPEAVSSPMVRTSGTPDELQGVQRCRYRRRIPAARSSGFQWGSSVGGQEEMTMFLTAVRDDSGGAA